MSVTVLAWLAVPLAATLIAIAWTYLASRPARHSGAGLDGGLPAVSGGDDLQLGTSSDSSRRSPPG